MTVAERRQLDFNRDAKRRQSAGLAGLSSKSKVTNSPFLQSPSPSMEEALSPDTNPNFAPSPLESASSVTTGDSPSLASATSFSSPPRSPESNPPAMQMASPAPVTPTKPSSTKSHLSELAKQEAPPTPSPKSSLKTRRLRGPRLSKDLEGGVPLAKRERRKTVTFTERPEVSFFEKDTSAEMSEQDTGGDGEEEDSPDEYGGYEYEYEAGKGSPPSRTAEMGREESGAFEFEDGEAIPSPLPSSQDYDDRRGRFEGGSSNSLAIPVDDSYNDFTLHDRSSDDVYCATDNFVSSLVEDDFLSPVSVSSPIFLGPAVDLDDPDAPIPTAQLPPHPLASELPPLQQPDLPKQPSSETEPILMNGNVLEPSTHLHLANASSSSPVRTTRRSLSPSTSPASSSLTTRSLSSDRPDAHAHQSGPLPDPFLTVSTVQRLFSPPSKPKAAGGLGLGLPADEDGIPYGRSHHAERQQAVKALRRGELTEAEGKGSEEAAERTEKEDEDAQERSEELQRSSLVASRGLRLPDVDVFGETKMVRQVEQEREVENEVSRSMQLRFRTDLSI
jgi:serine/arginine repetitive matrix protein 2